MALTKTLNLQDNFGFDVEITDAYIRVDGVDADKSKGFARVGIYNKQGGRLLVSDIKEFPVTMDGGNFIAQAYAHLKTLPEFSDAVDC